MAFPTDATAVAVASSATRDIWDLLLSRILAKATRGRCTAADAAKPHAPSVGIAAYNDANKPPK